MWRKVFLAGIALTVFAGVARADELVDATKLMEIGDHAAALVKLDAAVRANPTNGQVRLLMARCFADCRFNLELVGAARVGVNNAERAMYELGILANLGKEGTDLLIRTISDPDARLARLAITTVANIRLASAVEALADVVDREARSKEWTAAWQKQAYFGWTTTPPGAPPVAVAAVEALSKIGGERAGAAILGHVTTRPDEPQDVWLAGKYVPCVAPAEAGATIRRLIDVAGERAKPTLRSMYLSVLDAEGMTRACREEKDAALLRMMCSNGNIPQAGLQALALRTDLPEADRLSAINLLRWGVQLAAGVKRDRQLMVECMVALTQDKSEAIRWTAACQLADLDVPKAVPQLVASLTGDHAREAIYKLKESKCPAALQPLLVVLADMTDADKQARYKTNAEAVFDAAVASGAEGETLYQAVKLLMTAAGSNTTDLRGRVPVGSLPSSALPTIIDRLLAENDVNFRRAGAWRLGALPPAERVARAERAMLDKDPEVHRSACQQMLGLVQSGQAECSRIAVLLQSDDEGLFKQTASVLAEKGDKAVADAFLTLTRDPKRASSVMSSILAYFARNPDSRAVGYLTGVILDENFIWDRSFMEVAAKGVKGGATDLPAAAKTIAQGLTSKSSRVRDHVAIALRVIGDKSVLEQLQEAARKADPRSAERKTIQDAIRALGGTVSP
ncbi:MAG: hypothetical protein BIFFINMI_03436 [Phycisphaerae bacterium]|nr:hypothetical protein [Phycisphaerae bacterium]